MPNDVGPPCTQCGKPVTAGAAFCAACGAPTGAPAPSEPTVLERLRSALADKYAVEDEIGRGGMATVYSAMDVRHDRRVAIKVLLPELAASVGGDRFIREIRVAAKLQHPHILTLYDSGNADGLLYYVMPFVVGESLREKIDREKMLAVDEALSLTIEVAEALGHAHELGIVHRDIKPENILLAGGHALVADFGIARAVSAADEHKLTQTGTAVGTPLYMSPEQSLGDEVGPSADLYSLACVTFEMLTGQPPFTGANARAIMARHTIEQPPGIRSVRETVPEEVEQAVFWALNKNPADRPRSAAQFIETLATPLASGTGRVSAYRARVTVAPRISGVTRAAEAPHRKGILAALALVVVAGGAAAGWALLRPPPALDGDAALAARHIAVLYFEDDSPDGALGYLADGLTEGLIGALREVSDLSVVSRGGSEQFKGSTLPADSIARALGVGTLVTGSVREEGSDVAVTVNLMDASGAVFDRASARRPLADPLALQDTLRLQVAGLVRRLLGREVRLREQRQQADNPEAWVLVQRADRQRGVMDSAATVGDDALTERAWARADSMLAQAERLDGRWIAPITQRAQLAYARSRRAADDPAAAEQWIGRGLGHAERALALDARDPDALEIRGNLRYWRWLLQLERNPARAAALLQDAKTDLETAVQVRPSQAGAWATLSHLYNQTGTTTDVNMAARSAMEADAFLSNADVILQRLFYSSYDAGQFPDARHWCYEGLRRFPANPRFTECRLMMLTTRNEPPDVPLAWRLADSLVLLSPAGDQAYAALASRMWTAGVLARAARAGDGALGDSARHVVRRSLGDAIVDPSRDLTYSAAFVYAVLADTAAAFEQLTTYLTANPGRRSSLQDDPGWWFRSLAGTPQWARLLGTTRP